MSNLFDSASAAANPALLVAFGETIPYAMGVDEFIDRQGIVDQPMQTEEYDPKFVRVWFAKATDFTPAIGDRMMRGEFEYRVIKVRDDGQGGWRINGER